MKTLNINEIVEETKGPIWVINSANDVYPSGAEVFVTFINNGQSSIMAIPRTWLPIEITNRFPRKVIVESPYFIEALSSGLLKAITAETAAAILKQPGASKEQARLVMIEEAVKAATQARGIGKNVMITSGDEDRDQEQQEEHDKRAKAATNAFIKSSGGSVSMDDDGDTEEAEEISANFKGWVNKINLIEDQDEARNEVKLRGSMEIAEAEYLLKNCIHENITASLAKRLKALAAQG